MMSIPPVSHPSNSAISNCSIISDNMPTARRHSSSTSAEMAATSPIPSSSASVTIQPSSKRTSNGKSKARTKSLQPQTLCPICELPLSSSEFDRHYAEELEELRLDDPSKSILLAYTDESYMPTKKRRAASLKSMSSDKPKRGQGQRAAVDVVGNVKSVLLKTKNARKSRGTRKAIYRSSNSNFTHGMSSMNCFVCGETIYGDGFEMNNHIDACLERRERSVATHSTNGSVIQTRNSDGQSVETERNESIESIINSTSSSPTHLYTSHQYDELDSSALLALTSNPSANSSTGHLSSNASSAADSDIELDIDIDGDEETTLKPTFGETQFSEKDILKFDQTGNGLRELIAGIDDEGEIVVDDASSPLKSDFFVDIETPGTDVDKLEKPNWTVTALKERIKELERSSTSSHNCQICFSPYTNPVTSILCWHVYCEDCWLQSLACKKLCPSCTNVTGAGDLRKIYL